MNAKQLDVCQIFLTIAMAWGSKPVTPTPHGRRRNLLQYLCIMTVGPAPGYQCIQLVKDDIAVNKSTGMVKALVYGCVLNAAPATR